MKLEDLANQMESQHTETKKAIGKLGDKIECVKIEQAKMNATLKIGVIKVGACEVHRDAINDELRKVGRWNKIGTAIAVLAATLAGYLGFGGK